jgi:DNA helicase-2/ATP-dependent DNA helicase PcrA
MYNASMASKAKSSFDEAYKALNKAQKEAVDTIEGPVMVVAGPGTGKTTILTLRIANILKQTDTAPENILALTFTNSGVHAMRRKLLEYIGDEAYRVGIFTFHSFAEHIIREFASYFPQFEFAHVAGDLERVEMLEEIIKQGSFSELVSAYDEFSSLMQILGALDSVKSEGLTPQRLRELVPGWESALMKDENVYYKRAFGTYKAGDIKPAEKEKIDKRLAKVRELANIAEAYQAALAKAGRYDFNDMILTVLRELQNNENLKLDLQEQYQYILVDEHQDTNEGQNTLIELLTDAEHLTGRPNLFTVGDEKQSIYRFQGASAETFQYFQAHYTDVNLVYLEENYRSSEHILDAAHSLITLSIPDAPKLSSNEKHNAPICTAEFSNYKFELLYLVEDIKRKLDKGTSPEEIAVIYRTNKHIDDVAELFRRKGIPYSVLSKEKLLEDSNIRNLVTLLRVIQDPHDSHHLAEALFIDFLHFDSYDVVELLSSYRRENKRNAVSFFSFLTTRGEYTEFLKVLKSLRSLAENTSFRSFFKKFLDGVGYIDHLLSASDSREQLARVDTLIEEVKRQSELNAQYGLADFIDFVDRCIKYNIDITTTSTPVVEGVLCMTAHKSKGLEFEHVYIIDATRGSWEKRRGGNKITLPIKDYKGTLDDERRLFYVAMTRAKQTLTISSSLSDWEGRDREKSQFVNELDEAHLETVDTKRFEKGHIEALSLFVEPSVEVASIFDTDYLRKLFLEKGLSVTALNNYLRCPIRYLFRSLIQLPSEYSPFLIYGEAVHEALERFFEEGRKAGKTGKKKLLLDSYKEALQDAPIYGNAYEKYCNRGGAALTEYYDTYHTDWSTQIENEKRIERAFALKGGETLRLTGVLDKLEYLDSTSEGRVRIIDYKTGKAYSDKSRKSEKDDLRRQIIFYHLLMDEYKHGAFRVEEAVLDFIEKNKKGMLEQHTFVVEEKDKEAVEMAINELATDVMSGAFLKKGCGKRDCDYCALKHSLSIT